MPPNEPSQDSRAGAGAPNSQRGAIIFLVASLVLLAALVWTLKPERPNVKPAPLRAPGTSCPNAGIEFTPTNFTEIPGLDLDSLSPRGRNHALLRLNFEPCPCGCNTSIAYCFLNHPACDKAKELAREIVSQERSREHP